MEILVKMGKVLIILIVILPLQTPQLQIPQHQILQLQIPQHQILQILPPLLVMVAT
jgi:hypothetical protein